MAGIERNALMESLLDCNPNQGRRAYVSARDSKHCIKMPCELQTPPEDHLGADTEEEGE